MIVQLTGNINYKITLDPTVWIFDDRKVLLEEAFIKKDKKIDEPDKLKQQAERWSHEVNQQRVRPPVNKSINRFEKEKILVSSYVMPIDDFLENSEVKEDAKACTLVTSEGQVEITLDELKHSYLLFAIKGKPLQEDGPVHLLFKDGSNKDNPIKGINKIIIT